MYSISPSIIGNTIISGTIKRCEYDTINSSVVPHSVSIFSSVFTSKAVEYIENTSFNIEDEKMAVIIQKIVGHKFGDYFYPHISGVSQSYNYYPTSYLESSDGITSLALGMGKAVVDGMKTYRYCPLHPNMDILQPIDVVKNSQTEFFALDLSKIDFDLTEGEITNYAKLPLTIAEENGSLKNLISVWDVHNDRFVFDTNVKGARVLNFAPIVKFDTFPLSDILNNILDIGKKAMGVPVEIEFAVDLTKEAIIKSKFYVLQIRPLTVNSRKVELNWDKENIKNIFVKTNNALGNGVIGNIRDIIYLVPELFDNTKTLQMVREIEQLNQKTNKYILIGPGRWGTSDRWLGVPVRWADISGVGAIVEAVYDDFRVEPSQGSHFFHNITTQGISYVNISGRDGEFIDWDWLRSLPVVEETEHVANVRLKKPLTMKVDGRSHQCVLLPTER